MTLNWKKIFLFATVSAFAPVLGQWQQCIGMGTCPAFNVQNVVVPAIPALITTLAALFSNPRQGK